MAISLSVSGMSALHSYLDKLDAMANPELGGEVADNLAKKGESVGAAGFAISDYAGELNEVSVTSAPVGSDSAEIRMEGETLYFIEYGTGVKNPSADYGKWSDLYPKDPSITMAHGSYGYGLGSFGQWVYEGNPGTNGIPLKDGKVLTSGNPAANIVPLIADTIEKEAVNTVKEVLKL